MSYAQRGGEETKYEQEMGPRMTPRTTPRNMPPPSMHSYDRTTPRHMPPPSMHSFNATTPKSMPPQSMHSFSGTPRNMPPASMHSYDMDDVMVDPYTGLAYKQPPRTTCERHRGKFICLGVTLGLLLVLGILIAIFFPRAPQITLFNSSVLAIDGFTGATARFVFQIRNRNLYQVSFQNLVAEVYDTNGIFLGTILRPGRFQVFGRATGFVTATGVFRSALPQLANVGMDCMQNGMMTHLQLRTSGDLLVLGTTRRVVSSATVMVNCNVQNINNNGGMGGGRVAGGGVQNGWGNGMGNNGMGRAGNNGWL